MPISPLSRCIDSCFHSNPQLEKCAQKALESLLLRRVITFEKFPENFRQPRREFMRYSTQMPLKLSGIQPQEP
jgi:hypothetical protein